MLVNYIGTIPTKFECMTCHLPIMKKESDTSAVGGVVSKIKKCWICYDCAAKEDQQCMIKDGHSKRLPLYLSLLSQRVLSLDEAFKRRKELRMIHGKGHTIIIDTRSRYHGGTINTFVHHNFKLANWPSTLVFPIRHVNISSHNWGGERFDVWFEGPDGYNWWGWQTGDTTQICHCRRTKEKIDG